MRIVLTRRERLDDADGVNIFMVALAQALWDQGHEVKIVSGSMESKDEYRRLLAPRVDLPVLALSSKPLKGFASGAAWLRAKREIDKFRPDLIIHNEAVPLPFRSTVVHVVHGLERRTGRFAPAWRAVRRFGARRSDFVVATTTELQDEIVDDLGMPHHRTRVIPACIDHAAYHGVDLALRERAILHAGTLPYKDPGATIQAFGVLNDPSVTLYIVGEVNDATRSAVDSLPDRLRESVVLLGPADGQTVQQLHGKVRVAAFPTRYAIPVASPTVVEAVASRTPVVGSQHLSRDVLVHGTNGLVTETNPSAMAAALKAVLNDDELWTRLSLGTAGFSERFDASRVAQSYIELAATGRKKHFRHHILGGLSLLAHNLYADAAPYANALIAFLPQHGFAV